MAAQNVEQSFKVEPNKRKGLFGSARLEHEAILSKTVRGDNTENLIEDRDALNGQMGQSPFVQSTLAASLERVKDNANMLQLLPDIRLSMDLLIGGVLSPKDGSTVNITVACDNPIFSDVSVSVCKYLEDYFVTQYKLKDKLSTILDTILCQTGSYPQAILPETSVDDLINSNVTITTESLNCLYDSTSRQPKPLGLISPFKMSGDSVSTEGLDPLSLIDQLNSHTRNMASGDFNYEIGESDLGITITDNFDVLKAPEISRQISNKTTQNAISSKRRGLLSHNLTDKIARGQYSAEGYTKIKPTDRDKSKEELNRLYPMREYSHTPMATVKSRSLLDKKTVGHPLVIKLPTESVIPIHSPTDPSDHIGYYVLLDQTGNPVRLLDLENVYKALSVRANGGDANSSTSSILQNTAKSLGGISTASNTAEAMQAYEQAVPVFTQAVEKELIDRLERGSVGRGLSLGGSSNVYQIMLARALMKKRTQILYVPASLMSYGAIDYDSHGLGKTLLDDGKTLAALRSMSLFITSMANAKNAITRRNATVSLSPQEKNPRKAEDIIIHEIAKGTMATYPLTNSPADQINYLQSAGLNIVFEDHPRLPNTKVEMDYVKNDYASIDTNYDDWLKKQHINSFGLTPDLLDNAGNTDFAAQVIFSNILTQRKIKSISDAFSVVLTNFVSRYAFNSDILFEEVRKQLVANKIILRDPTGEVLTDEETAKYFLESIEVRLPQPDLQSVKDQSEAFTEYSDLVDKLMPLFLNDQVITEEALGRIGENASVEQIAQYIKNHYLLKWLKENGVATEMFEMLASGKDGAPKIDIMDERNKHLDAVSKLLFKFKLFDEKRVKANNDGLDKVEGAHDLEPAEGGDDFSSDTGSDDTGMDGGDDFGDNDFGDGDMGGDDPEAETEKTEGDDPTSEEGDKEGDDSKDDEL